MNKEQAIERLQEMKWFADVTTEDEKAIDMAIKSLKRKQASAPRTDGKYTTFFDMHSGGGRKSEHEVYILAGDEKTATKTFKKLTGRKPNNVSCRCCGEDYSVTEHDNLKQAIECYKFEKSVFIETER